MRVLGIIQARVSSSRLPGKVLSPILGKPMLLHQIDRLSDSVGIDQLIVATSLEGSDAPVEQLCKQRGVLCYRGSLEDVLDRYYQAAQPYQSEHVVRLTGDCPLTDPGVIDHVIEVHLKNHNDYTSNCLEISFPDGLDVEVFRSECLRKAWKEARLPSEREHVTPYMRKPLNNYQLENVAASADLGRFRWTVDDPEDFRFVTAVYEALYPQNPRFSMHDILNLLGQRPELCDLNGHLIRNAGLQKSLNADRLQVTGGSTDNG